MSQDDDNAAMWAQAELEEREQRELDRRLLVFHRALLDELRGMIEDNRRRMLRLLGGCNDGC